MTDEIFGIDTSGDDCTRLMLRHIRADWIKLEPALYTGKWFDYRFLNPVQATYLYAHEMVKAYRRAFAKNIDTERAQYVRFLRDPDLFKNKPQTISGVWRGRQVADAMGMPYDTYLELAFEWTLRYWRQSNLPRPVQLYSDLVTDRASIDWDERQKDRLHFSTKPQYQNDAYLRAARALGSSEGLVPQNAHHEYLFDQVKLRGNRADIFAKLVYQDQVLPIDKVKDRVDDETFENVLDYADRIPSQHCYN